MKTPEILAPAGSWDQLTAAFTYGADACYLGISALSLRAQSQGFSWEQLARALKLAHGQQKKIYFCLNLLAQERHLPAVTEALTKLKDYPIDGVIIADPGVVALAQRLLPKVPIHLSTQANTANSEAVKFWQQQGISRINLARELDFRAIRKVRDACPDMELEAFVHGAMCMAISGRCLLSRYLNNRSANLGLCTNPCRFNYLPYKLIMEESERPGEPLWELEQDENYSRILAADDLCLVRYIKWFVKAGIESLKIEGRTKSGVYVGQVVDVYKTAVQDVINNNPRSFMSYLDELQQIGDRDFSSDFFLGAPKKIAKKRIPDKPVFAKVLAEEGKDKWHIQLKTQWQKGTVIQIMVPGMVRPTLAPAEYMLEDAKGNELSIAHPGSYAWFRAEHPKIRPELFLRLLARSD